jgi:hypothetical protein
MTRILVAKRARGEALPLAPVPASLTDLLGWARMSPALRDWLEASKPTASRRTQVLMAQLLWTLVGLGLCAAGFYWILQWAGAPGLLYAAPCLLVGLLKALFALDKVARRTLGRIDARGASRCALGFLSAKSWLLVAGMMAAGRLLRASSLPRVDLGCLYLAVGSGLLVASRTLWRHWWLLRPLGLEAAGDARR